MRLHLLPISTRRTLLYCKHTHRHISPQLSSQQQDQTAPPPSTSSAGSSIPSPQVPQGTPLLDRLTHRAATTWASWEKKESGWQKWTVQTGNKLLRRIPYEEWSLKSVPPLSKKRRSEEAAGKEKIELVFPPKLINPENAIGVLQRLGTERQALHKQRLLWCFIGMPISAPIGLVPLVPNLPFFYLVYRAWSHWRALEGGKHIQFLTSNNLITLAPSKFLDSVYDPPNPETPTIKSPVSTVPPPNPDPLGVNGNPSDPSGEAMLLTQANGRRLAQGLDLPELEIELERAIWQVENHIREKKAEVTGEPLPLTTEEKKP